jgi:hypothetical protein
LFSFITKAGFLLVFDNGSGLAVPIFLVEEYTGSLFLLKLL